MFLLVPVMRVLVTNHVFVCQTRVIGRSTLEIPNLMELRLERKKTVGDDIY